MSSQSDPHAARLASDQTFDRVKTMLDEVLKAREPQSASQAWIEARLNQMSFAARLKQDIAARRAAMEVNPQATLKPSVVITAREHPLDTMDDSWEPSPRPIRRNTGPSKRPYLFAILVCIICLGAAVLLAA
jgi:hypothetical protein